LFSNGFLVTLKIGEVFSEILSHCMLQKWHADVDRICSLHKIGNGGGGRQRKAEAP
jgi:hypothetical protein